MRGLLAALLLVPVAAAAQLPPGSSPPNPEDVIRIMLRAPDRARASVGAIRQLETSKVGPLVTLVQRPDLPLLFGPQNLDRVQRVLTDSIVAQKDPSTLGVLQTLFVRAQPNAARAAARGLGWMCQSGGFQFLVLHLKPGDAQEELAIEGLSECLDVRAAKLLASRLATSNVGAELDLLASGAASLGNKAAWSQLTPARQGEGLEVHDRLSSALMIADHQHPRPSLKAAFKALNP